MKITFNLLKLNRQISSCFYEFFFCFGSVMKLLEHASDISVLKPNEEFRKWMTVDLDILRKRGYYHGFKKEEVDELVDMIQACKKEAG